MSDNCYAINKQKIANPNKKNNPPYKTFISSWFFPLSRQDMSKGLNVYWHSNIRRQYHTNWHKDPGCKHQPLFKIPLDYVIFDELHLMLRVTDRLEEGLIYEMLDWDEVLKNE